VGAVTIGQRALATPRYLRHPPANTSTWPLSNTYPLDAGTVVHLLDNNPAHLQTVGTRQLVNTHYGRQVTVFPNGQAMWLGIDEVAPVISSFASLHIPWDRRCSVRTGPWPALADVSLDDGTMRLRTFALQTDVTLTGPPALRTVWFAATTTLTRPVAGTTPGVIGTLQSVALGPGTGHQVARAAIAQSVPFTIDRYAERWRCRADGSRGAVLVAVCPVYLWFGWQMVNAGGGPTATIHSFGAWETRT
jgi:hypothetical protein